MHFNELYDVIVLLDHSKGFGGKFGVQSDRQDESAADWAHKENVEKHPSQKGRYLHN